MNRIVKSSITFLYLSLPAVTRRQERHHLNIFYCGSHASLPNSKFAKNTALANVEPDGHNIASLLYSVSTEV